MPKNKQTKSKCTRVQKFKTRRQRSREPQSNVFQVIHGIQMYPFLKHSWSQKITEDDSKTNFQLQLYLKNS